MGRQVGAGRGLSCGALLLFGALGCGTDAKTDEPARAEETRAVEVANVDQAARALPASIALGRPLAPLAGSVVSSRRPELRWAGHAAALIQICADRACRQPLQLFLTTSARRAARPPRPLPAGVVFWRLLARIDRGGLAWTPAWELFVPAGEADVPAATRGLRYDANADGYADAAIREQRDLDPTEGLHVYGGGADGLAPGRETVLRLPRGPFNLIAAGDVNGDGFGDLASQDGRGVVFFAGSASGVIATPLAIIPYEPFASLQLAAGGDVDGDGYGDVFVWHSTPYAHVTLHRGSTAGPSLTPAWTSVGGAQILAAADFNGDGFTDLAYADAAGIIRVFSGGSAGLEDPFGGQVLRRPSFIKSGGAGDLDGDGFIDLVTLEEDGTWAVFLGGPGPLPLDPDQANVYDPALALQQIGDFDGDGRFDVAAKVSRSTDVMYFTDDTVSIFRGQPGGISPTASWAIAEADVLPDNRLNFGSGLASADLDRDGFEDLLVGAAPPYPTPFFEMSPGAAFVFGGSNGGVQAAGATRLDGVPGFGIRVTAGAPQSH